ncbi:MAG: type II toxin-antitoxin system HigA family antitoxin [Bryobacteraceae bacterium]
MPTATYEQLLIETLPTRIENEERYDLLRSRFGALLAKRRRTAAEDKLMRLLGVLIQDYDRRNALGIDDGTPADRLQYLMERSETRPADLLPIFGQRSHVNEAINGKRKIGGDQARKLGELFRVKPGLFI